MENLGMENVHTPNALMEIVLKIKNVPSIVESLQNSRITLIDSLSTHSVAVTEDGILYTWGNGDKHRLGHGTTSKEYLPRPVQALSENLLL